MAEVVRLKRAVIKEEYIAITGDFQKAVILNQFIYWSERVRDFDDFIRQENKRATEHGLDEQDLTNGWIYKTAEELSEETMLGLSSASMRSHIKALIEKGFVSERNNPKYKWDRTKQYRVNLVEIANALMSEGYAFEGYKTELPFLEIKNGENENSQAIPKITPETTPRSTKNNISPESEFETLWQMYPRKIGKDKALKAYIKARKKSDIFEQVKQGIEAYCQYIKTQKIKTEYIKHGSTWFNNCSWNDEYEAPAYEEPTRYGGTYL